MFNLNNKIAFVTGGSYGSIGFSIVKGLSQAGATVIFSTTNQKTKEQAMEKYVELGLNVHGYVLDVSNEKSVNEAILDVEKKIGTIDILVNNAGIIKRVPMHEMEVSDFRHVIDVDLNGPFIMTKAVLPSMMKKRSGKIINICSMMSEFGRETVSAYAAAKGGLKMLTKNIASEYGGYNIQCNGLGPGYIETSLTKPLMKNDDGSSSAFNDFIISKTPAMRWGVPDDLIGPIVFLASKGSDFINGQILYADGGLSSYIGKQIK